MKPGDDSSRPPRQESGHRVNTSAPDRKTTVRIAEVTDSAMLGALALAGDWPSWIDGYEAGWRTAHEHGRGQFAAGRRQAVEEMDACWAELARQVRRTAGEPDYRELQRRRGLPGIAPVRPVPSSAECMASWKRPAQGREVAA